MASAPHRILGFTLIELMVTIAVLVVLTMIALPSFSAFRQRSALRGGAEQAMSFWNQARFEAAKRNQMVKVGVSGSGANFCLGAATTSDPADDTPCDCTSATACNVAIFPGDNTSNSEWQGVSLNSTTLAGGDGVAVIEPKRAALATAAQAGVISLDGPPGSRAYRLNLRIDELGRALLCESNLAADSMSDYGDRRCDP